MPNKQIKTLDILLLFGNFGVPFGVPFLKNICFSVKQNGLVTLMSLNMGDLSDQWRQCIEIL